MMSPSSIPFLNYEESTIDPGWSLVSAVTIIFCLLHITMPCLVSLGSRYEKRRAHMFDSPHQNDVMPRKPHQEELSSVSGSLSSKVTSGRIDVIIKSERVGGKCLLGEELCVRPAQKRSRSEENKQPNSVEACESKDLLSGKSSTGTNGWFYAIADKLFIPPYPMDETQNDSSPARSIRTGSSRGNSHCNVGCGFRRPCSIRLRHISVYGNNRYPPFSAGVEVKQGKIGSSSSSHQKESIMSKIDHDAISFREAADDYGRQLNNNSVLSPKGVDFLWGEQAWWKPAMIKVAFDFFVEIAELDKEMIMLARLSSNFSLRSVMPGLFSIGTVALVGHLVGEKAANAYIIISILSDILSVFSVGFLDVLEQLVPDALATGNNSLAGQYFFCSLIFFSFGSIPQLLVMTLFTGDAIRLFGMDKETAYLGQQYAFAFVLIDWIRGIDQTIQTVVDAMGHKSYSFMVEIALDVSQLLSVLVCSWAKQTDLAFIGLVQAIAAGVLVLMDVMFVSVKGWFLPLVIGMFRRRYDWNYIHHRKFLWSAFPLSCGWFLTYGNWKVLTILASALGPAEMVSFGLLGFLWNILEMFSDGIAEAGELRCAYHLGSNDPSAARRSTFKSLLMSFFASFYVASALYLVGYNLVELTTPNQTLRMLMKEAIPLLGVAQMALTCSTMSWSLISSQIRFRLGSVVQFFGIWIVAMPLGALSAFVFNVNIQGLVAAMALGYTLSGTMNLYILLRSQWERVALFVSGTLDDADHINNELKPEEAPQI